MVLTDEGNATTYFPYSTALKGAKMTLVHVESNYWRAAEHTPDRALPQLSLYGGIILVQNNAGFR